MSTTYAPRPVVSPAADWHHPRPEQFTLNNGLTVSHFHRPGQFIATVQVVIPVTVRDEPAGKEGLAGIVAKALAEGPTGSDAASFATDLECVGADLNLSAHDTGMHIRVSAATPHLEVAVGLLASALRSPRLSAQDVERIVDHSVDDIQVRGFEIGEVAQAALDHAYFAQGRREHLPVFGTASSVAGIDVDDVVEFARTRVRPEGARVIVAGDVDAAECRRILESTLGTWSSDASPEPVEETPAVPEKPGLYVVDAPGSVQTALTFAAPAVTRHDPHWFGAELATHVLGGSMESMLNMRMREEHGYTYGVQAMLDATREVSRLVVSTAVDGDATPQAVADLHDVMTDWAAGRLDESEIRRGIDEVTAGAASSVESSGRLVASTADLLVTGLPDDWPDQRRRAIQALTPDSVREALRHVDLSHGVLVLVGDARTWGETVEQAGFGPATTLTLSTFTPAQQEDAR